ncbi:unnamed protein product [Protopolystoma xenopodis]|uniref:Uncharacterized protein n=1 Tax=Protopolystoma xenopodis TaxID=117903 RepID=A0A448X1D6_9PLAT|nr:unnamed protein product [Protopolystoma xenopodis]
MERSRKERAGEVVLLRERASSAEERAEANQRELERLRDRLVECEREAGRLSRSLSAERFEKERALSELRLSTLPAAYRPSGYTTG